MLAQSIGRPIGVMVALLMWLMAGTFTAEAQRSALDDDEPETSFSELDRYGRWTTHPEWGTVWVPNVDRDWRPYTVGRWVNTEEHGWYWDSDEPFGWAVYHYGRWLHDEDEGWMWVPGTEWGPAWVAWRYGDDAVGWAPLPPRATWTPDRGVVIEDEFYEAASYRPFWIFVTPQYLLSPGLHRYALPFRRNVDFFHRTRPATHYGWANRRVYNHGIRIHEVERLTRNRVAPVSLRFAARPGLGDRRGNASTVVAYRPTIVPSSTWRAGRSGDWRRFDNTPAARERVPARLERNLDARRPDGAADGRFGDRDRNGIPDRFERNRDRDRDGIPDRAERSRDHDRNGIPDRFERNRDRDRDGIPDRFERRPDPSLRTERTPAPTTTVPPTGDATRRERFNRDGDRDGRRDAAPRIAPQQDGPRNSVPREAAPVRHAPPAAAQPQPTQSPERVRPPRDRDGDGRPDARPDRGDGRRSDFGGPRPFEGRDFRGTRDSLGAGPSQRVEPPREPQRPAFAPPPARPAPAATPPPPPPRQQISPPPPARQSTPPPQVVRPSTPPPQAARPAQPAPQQPPRAANTPHDPRGSSAQPPNQRPPGPHAQR